MTPLDVTVRHVAAAGLRLRKAVPKGPDRLLLELTDHRGRLAAGQWLRRPAHAVELAQLLQTMHGPGSSVLLGDGVVIALDGCDRRLPALHREVRRPGARLVAHRSERRGVVQRADGSYLKVVRPARLDHLVTSLASVDVPGLVVPSVTAADAGTGCIRMAGLPGRTLHSLLQDAEVSDHALGVVLRRVGAAVAELHRTPLPPEMTRHDRLDELDVTRGWLQSATDYGLLAPHTWTGALSRARQLLSGEPSVPARLHRDLHDKQLLIAPGGPVGLLDLDLSAAGEPALDLANLLTHLHLRHLQGIVGRTRSRSALSALLDGYAPDPVTTRRLPGYLLDTRLRLAAVYAFRAADPELTRHLLDPALDEEVI